MTLRGRPKEREGRKRGEEEKMKEEGAGDRGAVAERKKRGEERNYQRRWLAIHPRVLASLLYVLSICFGPFMLTREVNS